MRNLVTVFLCFMMSASLWAIKYEIDDIYYNIGMDMEAEVTYKGYSYITSQIYSGDVVIPSAVTINGREYPVTSIDSHAFFSCKDLNSVVIPNTVTFIGEGAFDSSGVASVSLPNGLLMINNNMFGYCSRLTSVEIPESVQVIGEAAFIWCTGLTSITIPAAVVNVKNYAFESCTNLKTVTCLPTSAPKGYEHVFLDVDTEAATLIVPTGSLEEYKTTVPWNAFGTIKTQETTICKTIQHMGEKSYYDLSGRRIVGSQKGVVLEKTSNRNGIYVTRRLR